MKRIVVLVVLATLFLPACGHTDRPECVVERWLISLNQGAAGRSQKYAPDQLSQQILPHWQTRDPGELDVIEVGKGRTYANESYLVPFRAERIDGSEISRVAIGSPNNTQATWHVEGLLPSDASLPVPSRGGHQVGGAGPAVWLAGVGIAVLLVLMSMALMSPVGKEARVSG
jgi:hypothetical protein